MKPFACPVWFLLLWLFYFPPASAQVQGPRFLTYHWVSSQSCSPITNFFRFTQTGCVLDKGYDTGSSIGLCNCSAVGPSMNVTVVKGWDNSTQSVAYAPSVLTALGVCTATSSESILTVLDTPGLCGPTIEQCIEHGRAYQPGEWNNLGTNPTGYASNFSPTFPFPVSVLAGLFLFSIC